MKSKWYLSDGNANLPCDERSWVIFGKSLQGKNLKRPKALLLYLRANQHHILMMILLYSFCYFFILWWGSPLGRDGDWASGCRGNLELWGNWKLFWTWFKKCWRSKTKHRKPQLKDLHMCSPPASTPATPGLVPSWESSYIYMCADRHVRTHILYMCMHPIIAGRDGKQSWEREVSVNINEKMRNLTFLSDHNLFKYVRKQ